MGNRKVIRVALALTTLTASVACAAPSVSSASTPSLRAVQFTTVGSSLPAVQFTTAGSRGYRISVFGAIGGCACRLTISASKPGTRVIYTAPAKVSSAGISASFGRLGFVSMRFQPTGAEVRTKDPDACLLHQGPIISEAQPGAFVGTLRFRGEHGYTQVLRHRVKGLVGDPRAREHHHRTVCANNSPAHSEVVLNASGPHSSPLFFGAPYFTTRAPGPEASSAPRSRYGPFVAFILERRGHLFITRGVIAPGSPADFHFDESLDNATVNPPPPFSGRATFRSSAHGPSSWRGTLRAPFPGRGVVRLAGPRFTTEFKMRKIPRVARTALNRLRPSRPVKASNFS